MISHLKPRTRFPIGTIITAGRNAGWSWQIVEKVERIATRGETVRPGCYVLRSLTHPDQEHSIEMEELHEALGEKILNVIESASGVPCTLFATT